MPIPPRREIRNLAPAIHGGLDYAELESLGVEPESLLDFSVSSNPFGPPPGLRLYTNRTLVSRYPDSACGSLRRAIAEKLGLSPENILVGSGSTELIRLCALAYLGQQDRAIILEPTFGEYEAACQIAGASIIKQRFHEEDNFSPDLKATAELVRLHSPRLVFLNNPNNPTGTYVGYRETAGLLTAMEKSMLVLDEAYVGFVEQPWSPLDMVKEGRLLVLRSMTKDYSLSGLRLGYAIAHADIIRDLSRVCPPWNVNGPAQQAALHALRQDAFLAKSRGSVLKAKNYLVRELTSLGYRCLPSRTNFFLVEVGNAALFRRCLLQRGVLVRDCSSFGLPQYVRIAPLRMKECRLLIEAVADLKGEQQ